MVAASSKSSVVSDASNDEGEGGGEAVTVETEIPAAAQEAPTAAAPPSKHMHTHTHTAAAAENTHSASNMANTDDEEDKLILSEMSRWMKDHCPGLRSKTIDKCARLFLEKNLHSMVRVGLSVKAEPDILVKIGVDKYDAADLISSLRAAGLVPGFGAAAPAPAPEVLSAASLPRLAKGVLMETDAAAAEVNDADAVEDGGGGEGVLSELDKIKQQVALARSRRTSVSSPVIAAAAVNSRRSSASLLSLTTTGKLGKIVDSAASAVSAAVDATAPTAAAATTGAGSGHRSSPSRRAVAPPQPAASPSLTPAALPPNWEQKVDKTSQRTYYINIVTKARSWKIPED